jgi:hypothetical protein
MSGSRRDARTVTGSVQPAGKQSLQHQTARQDFWTVYNVESQEEKENWLRGAANSGDSSCLSKIASAIFLPCRSGTKDFRCLIKTFRGEAKSFENSLALLFE